MAEGHRTEVLLDIDDVTLGSKKRARVTDPDLVVTSVEHAQEPLVDRETFDAVQERLAGEYTPRSAASAPLRTPTSFAGSSRAPGCRRMQGSWRQTRAYYQCRLADPAEYARSRAEALGAADGTRKGDLLSNLGVLVSYDPLTRRARVTCRPKVSESVVSEGGLEPPRP